MALLISSGNYSLSWDTPISSIIRDDFVLPDPYFTDHVTIEDALSHRTGMPRHDFSYGGINEKGKKRGVVDGVRSLRNLPLTKGLRTTFQYCNLMFVVASHVIETLTGVWLGDFLRERIWEPLGMNSTVCLLPQPPFFDAAILDPRTPAILVHGFSVSQLAMILNF